MKGIELFVVNSVEELIKVVGEGALLNVFFTENYSLFSACNLAFVCSTEFAMPFVINRKGLFKRASFLAEPCHYVDKGGKEREFLDAVCLYLKHNYHIQWLTQTPASALFKDAPQNALVIPFGSHIVNLEDDIDTLWSKVHSKHRNVIKKAEKEGVTIEKGINDKLLQDYHTIDIETWERSNMKANGVVSLKNMVDKMGERIVFYIAYKDGVPQAGAIFFYNQVMCYYMHGASRNHSFTGSSNLLHWQAIQDMKALGVKSYSFVGARINEDIDSKYHGIQRFKERFGGELVVGKRFKVVYNPFYYHMYNLLVSIKMSIRNRHWQWFRDSIDMELHKWRNQID